MWILVVSYKSFVQKPYMHRQQSLIAPKIVVYTAFHEPPLIGSLRRSCLKIRFRHKNAICLFLKAVFVLKTLQKALVISFHECWLCGIIIALRYTALQPIGSKESNGSKFEYSVALGDNR